MCRVRRKSKRRRFAHRLRLLPQQLAAQAKQKYESAEANALMAKPDFAAFGNANAVADMDALLG